MKDVRLNHPISLDVPLHPPSVLKYATVPCCTLLYTCTRTRYSSGFKTWPEEHGVLQSGVSVLTMMNEWRIKNIVLCSCVHFVLFENGALDKDDCVTGDFSHNEAQTSPFLAERVWGSVSRSVCTLHRVCSSAQRKYTQLVQKVCVRLSWRKVQKVTDFTGGFSCCYVTRCIFLGGREQVTINDIIELSLQQPLNR